MNLGGRPTHREGRLRTVGQRENISIAETHLMIGRRSSLVNMSNRIAISSLAALILLLTIGSATPINAGRGTTLRLRCGGDQTTPYWAMEFTASKKTCWMHIGHFFYFFGGKTFHFQRVTGTAFTVEEQLSPPTGLDPDQPGNALIYVDISMDGLTWETVGHGSLRLAEMRQEVRLDITGSGQPFRFLRIHNPPSSAEGLSGYLDAVSLDVQVTRGPRAPAATATTTHRALSCENDILEDFFTTHPCTFGGINRWDAPSFMHTYWLGGRGRINKIAGKLTLAPWRYDDYTKGGGSALTTLAVIQTSTDGVHWNTIGEVPADYGKETSFSFPLKQVAAEFVRFFPELHANFDYPAAPSHHHPRAYFLNSELSLDGALPSGPPQ